MASSPEGALLETLVHLELDPVDLPTDYQLLRVLIPDSVSRVEFDPLFLPDGVDSQEQTQALGNSWLDTMTSALLAVPSAIIPVGRNMLLNPRHPDAKDCQITEVQRLPFDRRLFRL